MIIMPSDSPAYRGSILHRIDPRVRLACAVAATICSATMLSLFGLAAATILAFCLALLAKTPLSYLWRRLRIVNGFMLLVIISLPFSVAGDPLFQLGPLSFSREGFQQALAIVLTGNTLVLMLLALVATIEPVVLAHAMLHLRVPEKLVRIMMFAIRYIEVLNRSRGRVECAMKARGYIARFNRHSLQASSHLVGRLMVESLERAQRIERAMRLRGWNGSFPVLYHFQLSYTDGVFVIMFAIGLVGIIGL